MPYSHHPYAYALSNPILLTDPSGRCSERGRGDDYCHDTQAESEAVDTYRRHHPTDTCGSQPETDPIFGPPYYCNERTGRYEPILGGTIAVTPGANGIKLGVGAVVLVCTAVATWLGLNAAASQPQTTILNYDVNPHAYGRPDHAKNEAEVRAAVTAAFEWWYNPDLSTRKRQLLFAGIAGPLSGPVMVIKYNGTRNVVGTAYYQPTLDEARQLIWQQGYTMPIAIAPIA